MTFPVDPCILYNCF